MSDKLQRFAHVLQGLSLGFEAGRNAQFVKLSEHYKRNDLGLVCECSSQEWGEFVNVVSLNCKKIFGMQSRNLSLAMISLAAATKTGCLDVANHFQNCFESSESATCKLVVTTQRTVPNDYPMEVGEYKFETFKRDELEYWAKKFKRVFPADLNQHNERLSVSSDWQDITLMRFREVEIVGNLDRLGMARGAMTLIDNYFQALLRIKRNEMAVRVREKQLVLLAAGAASEIELYDELGSSTTLLVNRCSPERGWFTFEYQALLLNTSPKSVYDNSIRCISSQIGCEPHQLGEDKPFGDTGTRLCEILNEAHKSRVGGKVGWALVQFVMALELLFCSDATNKISEKVAFCAAYLSHRAFRVTFRSQYDDIKAIYCSRSRLLHEAHEPSLDSLRKAEGVCREVLFSFLRASRNGSFSSAQEWAAAVLREAKIGYQRNLADDGILSQLGASTGRCDYELNRIRDKLES